MTQQQRTDTGTEAQAGNEKLIKIDQVLEVFPVSRSSWYAGIKKGEYPQQVQIGVRSVAWWEHEVLDLRRKRSEARGTASNEAEK